MMHKVLSQLEKEVEIELHQRKKLFRIKCTIECKCCDFIIDNNSSEKLMSSEVVHMLKLNCTPNLGAYRVSWLQNGHRVTTRKQCLIFLILGVIMIALYLMFFPWMHATFYWEGLGSIIEGLCMTKENPPISLRW